MSSMVQSEYVLDQFKRGEECVLIDAQWYPGFIEVLATETELAQSPGRREIMRFIRAYFESRQAVPESRKLHKGKLSLWGKNKTSRRNLSQLSTRIHGRQAYKNTGLRMSQKLILDI